MDLSFKFEYLVFIIGPFLKYISLTLIATFFVRRWLVNRNPLRNLSWKKTSQTKMRKEILNSMRSCFVFAVCTTGVFVAKHNGHTNIYDNISDYGIGYFLFSVPLMLVIHDTYFYFMHRLMHHPKLYKTFHFEHHKSLDPTAFSSYSFDLPEALIQVLGTVAMISLLPVHPFAIVTFYFVAFILNMVGHISYEMYPNNLIVRKIFTTPTHHHLHHHAAATNFSLYLTFWDRFFDTLHPDYDKIFDEVVSRHRRDNIEFRDLLVSKK